jgi:thiamine biosynthesis lipoprotein ApbE
MGSSCSIDTLGIGAQRLNRLGRDQVARLEGIWSRFLSSSDVCRVNASPGFSVKVSTETIDLALFALDAWKQSSGLFCPFLGVLMNQQGYNDTFEAIVSRSYQSDVKTRDLQLVSGHISRSLIGASELYMANPETTRQQTPVNTRLTPTTCQLAASSENTSLTRCCRPRLSRSFRSLVPTLAPFNVDDVAGTLCVEQGYALDFGGVAKGYAADLVADALMESGAKAVLVDLGGDVSCRTAENEETLWSIEAEGPRRSPSDYSAHNRDNQTNRTRSTTGATSRGTTSALEVGSIASIDLRNGGVATSSTQRRAWLNPVGERVHHLMNPQTQASAIAGIVLCSIAADSCAHAEVLTKMAICGGVSVCRDIANRFVPDVLAVLDNGDVLSLGSWITT